MSPALGPHVLATEEEQRAASVFVRSRSCSCYPFCMYRHTFHIRGLPFYKFPADLYRCTISYGVKRSHTHTQSQHQIDKPNKLLNKGRVMNVLWNMFALSNFSRLPCYFSRFQDSVREPASWFGLGLDLGRVGRFYSEPTCEAKKIKITTNRKSGSVLKIEMQKNKQHHFIPDLQGLSRSTWQLCLVHHPRTVISVHVAPEWANMTI